MVELDGQVSAVWKAILEGDWQNLCDRIMTFDVTPENINAEITLEPLTIEQAAFHTILKNRTYHGGILAAGSGLLKHGEAGKGVLSRWYPDTLRKRIEVIAPMRDRVTIEQSDGIQAILQHAGNPQAVFFVDPPYTSSKKSAGKRLYTHSQLDHEALFDALAAVQGQFIMTYDDAPEVEAMANARGFSMALVPMKGTHNVEMRELVISGNMDWLTSSELHHKLIN
jgi:DNA adenine methylase